jgi:hypothetical protein
LKNFFGSSSLEKIEFCGRQGVKMDKASIGVIGLGVMGHNLALNMEQERVISSPGNDLDLAKTKAH